ncbi:uncharacterized protein LOC130014523 isoform X2 [Mercurialis annua]|uniref:uncharacterized protein LOC130014523 isoform X2 n=1 Tax=Mercurialis annua TaxID=3986 RepID=UPI00215E025A|nr:uncharacterized protein LOC130014523 isoform X2 [Mercurialis annua]
MVYFDGMLIRKSRVYELNIDFIYLIVCEVKLMILKFEIWRILGGLHSSMELPHHPRDGMISFGKSSFRSFNSRKSFAQEVKEGFHSSSPQ